MQGQDVRKRLRAKAIAARDALTASQRAQQSRTISEKILQMPEFTSARTVMLYKAVKGEVQLRALEEANEALPAQERKRFVYPLCIEDHRMLAVAPGSSDGQGSSWKKGAFGIPEPVLEQGRLVDPQDIDLVIVPCVCFDENCHRLGMGGGYYDRFLPACCNAIVMFVAFECQRAETILAEAWDIPASCIVTEARVLRKR